MCRCRWRLAGWRASKRRKQDIEAICYRDFTVEIRFLTSGMAGSQAAASIVRGYLDRLTVVCRPPAAAATKLPASPTRFGSVPGEGKERRGYV